MTDDVERLLGGYGARLEHLEGEFEAIRKELSSQRKCLARIERLLSQAKGGWKTLTGLGVLASGVLGALLTWWLKS